MPMLVKVLPSVTVIVFINYWRTNKETNKIIGLTDGMKATFVRVIFLRTSNASHFGLIYSLQIHLIVG